MFQVFRKLGWFIKTYKKNYIWGITLLIFSYALMIIPPWIIGDITDRINQGTLTKDRLLTELGVFLVGIILGFIISYYWSYLLFKGSDTLRYQTRFLLMKKFLGQSPIFYEKNTTGSLMGKSTNDVNSLGDFAGFGFMSLVDSTLYPLSLIIIMGVTINWKVTLLAVIPMPLLIIVTRILEKKIYQYFTESQEAFDLMNDKVLENVSGVRVVRAFVREEHEEKVFHGLAELNYDKNFAFQKVIAVFGPVARIIPAISLVIALYVGSLYMSKGQITLGQMISFTVYLNMLIWPMMAFGEFITVSKEAVTAMDRIQELWDYQEDIIDPDNAIEYQPNGDIEFKNYNFRYPTSEDNILKNISFTLKNGQTLGIVGKIGSGKTTLVKQLLHLYPVSKNALYLDGIPMENYAQASVRRHIGYVPQQHILFSKTIRDNILLGARKNPDIEKAITLADFKKDLRQLPHGLETMTGEKGIALSGGQKQRISIARALIGEPDILILDDSLSAVDATTESKIIENIKIHRKNRTNIISAHRLSAVAHADLILVLHKGEIVQQGTHEKLLQEEGWYKEQFLHQKLEGGDQ